MNGSPSPASAPPALRESDAAQDDRRSAMQDDRRSAPPDVPQDAEPGSLAARLAGVRARIADACRRAGRDPSTVSLLAVSKTFGAERVLALAGLGQTAFGENYVQEAAAKMDACRDGRPDAAPGRRAGPEASVERPLEWHFIGPIQSNKTRTIAERFDWVHSVDREKIAARLGEQRPEALAPLQCCVQVNVSGEASKSGCPPEEAVAVARAIAAQPRLRLRGVMAIPEPTEDRSLQRRRFAAAREILEKIRDAIAADDPSAVAALDTLSMGMSADLESAIAEGATIVRVGSALFGERPRRPAAVPEPDAQ